jgi:hypothetical protein
MANIASGITGAASGAATGSAFGPVGTFAGGVIGGFTGLFGGGKKKKKPKRVSTLDPQQQAIYGDYVDSLRGEGPFSDLYNFDSEQANNVFDQTVGRPAYRSFQEKIVPTITGQFRSNNLQNSSYAGQALSRAGRDVQENLDAERARYQFQGQQNAQANKQNAINNILNMNTFDYQQQDQSGNVIDDILGKVAPKAGEWFADYLKGSKSSSNSLSRGSGGGGVSSLNNYTNNIVNSVR